MARGCALIFGVLLIIALAVWALAIGLWIVGALVGIFSVLGAVVMLYTGGEGCRLCTRSQAHRRRSRAAGC